MLIVLPAVILAGLGFWSLGRIASSQNTKQPGKGSNWRTDWSERGIVLILWSVTAIIMVLARCDRKEITP